ncbi:IS21 family transposase [Halodesulfovibrio aestuarii]|uniref:IS21 family transposase n=1 Tax=Halodesulfovibrio aestuarii TaxID=126333 RepID=A0ABV4JQQ3_9BACT
MSGKHTTEQQVGLYMTNRKTQTQKVSAARAGFSERTGRRIEKKEFQPTKGQKRAWRTRTDPLEAVWEPIVLPLLRSIPKITAVGIFDQLCANYSDLFDTRSRRTLERRINHWRQLHGPEKEAVFLQEHIPGELGITDFTVFNGEVTISGIPLPHRLFHYRLVASGWAFGQVVYGGESFSALATGLQQAFRASNGVPNYLRTDSLSAAFKNERERDDYTLRYTEFCRHYNVTGTRNNRGVAHENGAIESPNGHLKSQLRQALRIRGSNDFATRNDYEQFVQEIIKRRNDRKIDQFKSEQRQLQPLPVYDSVNYTEHVLRVSSTSTISIKRVTYSVPSRLIKNRVLVRLFDAHLELFCCGTHTLTLERVFAPKGRRGRNIDYKHIIGSLVKKPRAFRYSILREDILPTEDYRAIWTHVDQNLPADNACIYIVRLLHLAKNADCEAALGRYVLSQIHSGAMPSIIQCEDRFLNKNVRRPELLVHQHALSDYQSLLM